MKNSFLRGKTVSYISLLGILIALCTGFCVGCTYETTDETVVVEVAPDAAVAPLDAGQEEDGDVKAGVKGAGRSKQLTRGNPTPTQILSESFIGEDGKGAAGVYTVQFATAPTSGTVPTYVQPTLTYAIVVWKVEGNQIQRIISVSNGASLTGVGEGCTVTVYDATTVAAGDPVPNYNVTATLTPGSRGSSGNPPTYYPKPSAGQLTVPMMSGSNTVVIPIPENAGVISVQVTAGLAGGAYTLQPEDITVSQVAPGVSRIYSPLQYPGFIALDPSAVEISITNTNTTYNINWGCVFGIDG